MSEAASFKTFLDIVPSRLGKETVLETTEDPKDPRTITVKILPEKILPFAEILKESDYPYLSFITAVDRKKQIEMVYWFTSISTGLNVRVKCLLPVIDPEIDSLTGLYATADWNEREVFDMFGVSFRNHPSLRRILTWDDFEGHPLLKKYKVIDEPDEFPQTGEK